MTVTTADIIAGISALIALASFLYSAHTGKKINQLDRKLKEKELSKKEQEEEDAKKADIEVEKIDAPRGKTPSLRFYNKGQAEAHNVNFEITSAPDDDISLRIGPDYLPYPKLLPYQNFEIHYLDCSNRPHQTIVITWDDEFGKGRTKEMVIDM